MVDCCDDPELITLWGWLLIQPAPYFLQGEAMIKVKLNSPTSIIQKPGLTEFDLSYVNGAHVLTSRGFKQVLKSSEYVAIMAMSKKGALPVATPPPPATAPIAPVSEAKFEDDDMSAETSATKRNRRRGVI